MAGQSRALCCRGPSSIRVVDAPASTFLGHIFLVAIFFLVLRTRMGATGDARFLLQVNSKSRNGRQAHGPGASRGLQRAVSSRHGRPSSHVPARERRNHGLPWDVRLTCFCLCEAASRHGIGYISQLVGARQAAQSVAEMVDYQTAWVCSTTGNSRLHWTPCARHERICIVCTVGSMSVSWTASMGNLLVCFYSKPGKFPYFAC